MGYRMGASQLGFPGSPQTANQLGETVNALKQGVKAFEVSLIIPDTAEAIPKQHFNEMRALMKLSGVKPSMHGPMVDAAGWGEKGWNGEQGREDSERRMFDAIEKAHLLDPNGNVPIVFHGSAGVPGTEKVREGIDTVAAVTPFFWLLAPIERIQPDQLCQEKFLRFFDYLQRSKFCLPVQLRTVVHTDLVTARDHGDPRGKDLC